MARIIYVPLLGEGRREKGEGRRNVVHMVPVLVSFEFPSV